MSSPRRSRRRWPRDRRPAPAPGDLRRRRARRDGPHRVGRAVAAAGRPLALGHLRRQRGRGVPARLLRHSPSGAPAALRVPPAAARDRALRRADHVLDDAGRAAAHARPWPRRPGRAATRARASSPALRPSRSPTSMVRRARLARERAHRPRRRRPRRPRCARALPARLRRSSSRGSASSRSGRSPSTSAARSLLGVLLGAGVETRPSCWREPAALGSFTTFSTWMFEAQRLAQDGEWRVAGANLGLSLVAGLAARGRRP